jgi:lipopolysaccharide transport system ATP-binding protein
MSSVIAVSHLSKRYIIGHRRPKSDGIGAVVNEAIRSPVKWLRKRRQSTQREFWALNDISFEVKQGEVLGIIGRNGAGKSTLLKVLSRITEPTSGRIEIEGRVASLLEVGTGFHPELTGRENIFLNGAILGMSGMEIKRKFDEIVAFSEIERFLDTPVKRYSSGMYVRLAFAVAAHLEPEILIVDEVLAVGDAQFQNKCLGKMNEVAKQGGRTVLFVSHQMAAIANLCTACLVLTKGTVDFYGSTEVAMRRYLETRPPSGGPGSNFAANRASWGKPYITSARVLNSEGGEQDVFGLGSGMIVELSYTSTGGLPILNRPVMGMVIKHSVLGMAANVNMRMTGSVEKRQKESGVIRCKLESTVFLQGNYSIDLWLGEGLDDVDMLADALTFTIEDADIYGSGQTPVPSMGLIYLQPTWDFA